MGKSKMLLSAIGFGLLVIVVIIFTFNFIGKEEVQKELENDLVFTENDSANNEDDFIDEDDDLIDHDDLEEPLHLIFFSGVGAWQTVIELANDGSFTGKYEDFNGGESGNGYLSTTYMNEFNGQFSDIKKLDAETYSMELLAINYTYEDGEEWIEDKGKYIATEAYGFEEGEDFLLYSPNKNTQDLDEDLLSWGGGHGIYPNSSNESVLHWVLHNKKTNYGFYSDQYVDVPENEEKVVSNATDTLPTSFAELAFDNNYSGPGSEFIGTWHEVNYSTVNFAPNPWEVNYKDETFYIKGELPGDAAIIIMTAEYKDGKLYSNNGTQIEFTDYEDPITFEVNLPDTIEVGEESSQFYFNNGYLQWFSEFRGDFNDSSVRGASIEGYEKE